MEFPERVVRAFQMGINDNEAAIAILQAIVDLQNRVDAIPPPTEPEAPAPYPIADYDGSSGAVVIDLSLSNWHSINLTGNCVLTLINLQQCQEFNVILRQSATGSCLVTWFPTVVWPGGTAPVLSMIGNSCDIFTFKHAESEVFYGSTYGQSY